jgi:hypothetical protein
MLVVATCRKGRKPAPVMAGQSVGAVFGGSAQPEACDSGFEVPHVLDRDRECEASECSADRLASRSVTSRRSG